MAKASMWWRRKRKPIVWHFMAACPMLVTGKNPRSGTKCDHCQRLQKLARHK